MKKISLKNKILMCWFDNLILIGMYIGAMIVYPVIIKDLPLIILLVLTHDYVIFEITKDLRLDTKTNKILERNDDEC